MLSNAPLERLINTMMMLDGLSDDPNQASELRCLMRKVDWVATEAEAALKRCTSPAVAEPATPARVENAA